jgi:uncharacterized protein (DUF924 family)
MASTTMSTAPTAKSVTNAKGTTYLLPPPSKSDAHPHEEETATAPPQLRARAEFGVSQVRTARDIIARFGRHPHRNEILGRTSTPEELEYLRTETPPHMRRPPS